MESKRGHGRLDAVGANFRPVNASGSVLIGLERRDGHVDSCVKIAAWTVPVSDPDNTRRRSRNAPEAGADIVPELQHTN